MIQKLALAGVFKSGKDFVARQCGYKILGFADPIYALLERLCMTSDKGDPGVRECMQKIGGWGWGELSKSRPESIERIMFVEWVRENVSDWVWGYQDAPWHQFGSTKYFWTNIWEGRLRNLESSGFKGRIAVTNVRHEHEMEVIKRNGFELYLVRCSEESRKTRCAMAKEEYDIKTLGDSTESLARKMALELPDHRIIWNDTVPHGDKRNYLTLEQFKEKATK